MIPPFSWAAGAYNMYSKGMMGAFGFLPTQIDTSGTVTWHGWGAEIEKGSVRLHGPTTAQPAFSWQGAKARLTHGNPLSAPFLAYNLYTGAQENGFRGFYDAAALNFAVEGAAMHWMTGIGPAYNKGKPMPVNTRMPGIPLRSMGMASSLARYGGGFIAGGIGQSAGRAIGEGILSPVRWGLEALGFPTIGNAVGFLGGSIGGTLGAIGGSYFGVAPLRAIGAHPIIAGVAGAAAIGGMAAYGAYNVVKTVGQLGYERSQFLKGVHTDGSMAAFMTQNAITSRARAVQAISKSHLNSRSALGQEANFMSFNRNYHSTYR